MVAGFLSRLGVLTEAFLFPGQCAQRVRPLLAARSHAGRRILVGSCIISAWPPAGDQNRTLHGVCFYQ
jgi:hypothetical protein